MCYLRFIEEKKLVKEIWDSLEETYGIKDIGTKQYAVSRWIKFQIEDTKVIIPQIHK